MCTRKDSYEKSSSGCTTEIIATVAFFFFFKHQQVAWAFRGCALPNCHHIFAALTPQCFSTQAST